MKKMALRLGFCLCLLSLSLPGGHADSPRLEGLRSFSETGDGQWRIPVSGEGFEAKAIIRDSLPAGQYLLRAQVRAEGFPVMGNFVVAIKTDADGPARQVVSASPDWADIGVAFEIREGAQSTLRVFDAKGAEAGAFIELRGITIVPAGVKESPNLLLNGDFAKGAVGAMPDGWHWKYHGQPGDYSIQADRTFKTGQQVLQVTGSEAESRDLCSASISLPSEGVLTFNIWARSDLPGQELTLWMIGDDFRWKAKQSAKLTPEWKKYEVSAACPPSAADPFCYARIGVKGQGNARFADARLNWRPASEPTAKENGSDNRGRNLLWNPGFELGMNNWMFDFFAPDSYAVATSLAGSAQPSIVPQSGINGTAAMRLPNRYNSLITGCVPLEEGARYTLSAYVKAEKPGASLKMFLIDSGWKIYSKEFAGISQSEWTRVSLPITWDQPSKQKKIYARFDGEGIQIDNVQLEKGDITDFRSARVDAGFLSPDKNVFVRGGTQPALGLKIVSDQVGEQAMEADIVVRDSWGREVHTRTETIDLSGGQSELQVPLPDQSLGVFDVSATLKDPGGSMLTKCESRYALVDRPDDGKSEIPLFGINYEPLNTPLWLIENEMPLWRLMGVKFSRFFLRNRMYTLDPPKAYVDLLQRQCAVQVDSGFQALVACFNNIPDPIRNAILDGDDVDEPTLQAYGEYLRKIAVPLKEQVRYWEIANEPNLWRKKEGPDKGKKTMPPGKYVKLLKTAYQVIKSVDKDLQVVGICLNGNDYGYMEECLKLGAGQYMDIFSYHSYRESPDLPDVYNDLIAYRNLLDKYGFRGRLMNTEQYFASNKFLLHGSDEETRRNYYVADDRELEACSRTIRNYIYHAAAGVSYCAYSPQLTFFRLGGYDGYYVFYAFGAYNAATRFLGQAGLGKPVEMGSAIRSFIFPGAEGGPLVTINATSPDVSGSLKLRGEFEAFDFMGNRLPDEEGGPRIPVSHVPVYLKFSKDWSEEKIRAALLEGDVLGLGEAFGLAVSLADQKTLVVTVTNRLNKPVSGSVNLGEPPKNWRYSTRQGSFSDLEPGASIKVTFDGVFEVTAGESYDVSVAATAGDGEFVKKEISLAPILVPQLDGLDIDGDLSEWKNVNWINLGGANLAHSTSGGDGNRGDSDLSVQAAFAWSTGYFACAFRVKDEVLSPPDSSAHAWTHDSIQVYFDQAANNGGRASGFDGDDIVYSISMAEAGPVAWVEKGAEGRYVGEANASTGIDRDVEVAIVRKDGETIYEMKFPRACFPLLKLEKGQGFGFAFLVNDNDGKGRKPGMSLIPGGKEPNKNVSSFRDAYLN